MRLTCPSCGAVYEVPDSAIPEEGRDVQCTNCGHGWFQRHPSAPRAAPAPPPTEREPEPEAVRPMVDDAEDEAPVTARRTPIDPRTRRILREEAEREAEARRAERQRLRAIEDPAPPPRRVAREPDRIDPPSAAEAGLSPAAAPADARASGRGGGGFALGFLATLALAALLAAAYLFSDAVVEAAPGLAAPVADYVAWVDQARLAVNTAARAASTRLDAFLPSPATGS